METLKLDCGTGILMSYRDDGRNSSWKDMACELLDNALDAGATEVRVIHRNRELTIIDNGRGCPDVGVMFSPGRSLRYYTTAAGKFGVGCIRTMAYASQGGLVEVRSVTVDYVSVAACQINECIEKGELRIHHEMKENRTGEPSGTVITIHNCRKFADAAALAKELSFYYAETIRAGTTIILEAAGKTYRIEPYEPPPFARKKKFRVKHRGHDVIGWVGLVKPGEDNPHDGWHVHRAHRVMLTTNEPAGAKSNTRLFGFISLPLTWQDMDSNKSGFSSDIGDLWELIGDQCRAIIDASYEKSHDIALRSFSESVETALNRAVLGPEMVKGARPGKNVKAGPVKPKNTGRSHHKFTTSQPGDKALQEGKSGIGRVVDMIRFEQDQTMENIYKFRYTTHGGRIATLTVNMNCRLFADAVEDAKGDDKRAAKAVARQCVPILAFEFREMTTRGQNVFEFDEKDYNNLLRELLDQMTVPDGAKAQEVA